MQLLQTSVAVVLVGRGGRKGEREGERGRGRERGREEEGEGERERICRMLASAQMVEDLPAEVKCQFGIVCDGTWLSAIFSC